jgi:hypothetical protein
MGKLKVLLTGASGYLAGKLISEFKNKYDVCFIDIRNVNRQGQTIDNIEIVDLMTSDTEQLRKYFTDVDVVVHAGHFRPNGTDPQTQYDCERKNIDMMQRVYQLALDNGVKRVVSTSTVQAAHWYEQLFYEKQKDRVDPYEYPRPSNFYGWAKAAFESLGFLYACGSLGRKLEVVQLRIVVPREIDAEKFLDLPRQRYVRELAGYISDRDFQQLYCKSIETPKIEDEFGVPFHIFYGTSNNARTFWSITNARKVIGYDPQDDSEIRFAQDIARIFKK